MASEEDFQGVFELFSEGGSMPAASLGTAVRTLGLAPSEDELKDLVGKNGSFSYDQFKAAAKKCEAPSIEDVFEAFQTFDTNGNGYIPLKEFLHLMKNLGEGLNQELLDKLAVACEPDSDQQVNYRHFVDLMLKQDA